VIDVFSDDSVSPRAQWTYHWDVVIGAWVTVSWMETPARAIRVPKE
jgi:hypothetical protein